MNYFIGSLLLLCTLLGCSDPFVAQAQKRYVLSEERVLDGKLSHDGEWAALVMEGPSVNIWDVRSKKVVFSLAKEALPTTIRTFLFNKQHRLIIVAGSNVLQLWDINTGNLEGTLNVSGFDELARITTLQLSLDARLVGIGMTDGSVTLFNRENKQARRIVPHTSNVTHIHFLPDNIGVLSAAHDGYVKAWAMDEGNTLYSVRYPSRISTLSVARTGNDMFVSDSLKTQQVLNVSNGKLSKQLDYMSRFKWFRHALFLSGSPYLLTSSPKSELTVWHMSSGKEVLSWHIEAESMGTTLFDMIELSSGRLVTLNSEAVVEHWHTDELLFLGTQ
ncbi:hypothetical protein [Pseudoalteromonas sp. MMG005]|uniref:WD40 repeat domain-containing protein n=1 Tax=Pseudoalteromonas sp. MMG005 TaxID=2822682 RepID=UPI001B3A59F3|nr:hypothetical protein [Pseudoalteromonas sp. MMG005]MBQ4848310.1 hypothetical protein [Pseudoalteromonas sp. MMG005]